MAEADAQFRGVVEELICPVCLDLFKHPHTLPCDHSLCKVCLEKITKSNLVNCPLCRKTFELKEAKNNIVLRRIIDAYKEDVQRRLQRSQSCIDLTPVANRGLPKNPKIETLKQPSEFCRQYNDNKGGGRNRRSDGLLDLQTQVTNCSPSDDDSQCLTSCTANCTDPPHTAAVLCATCTNQFCRVCWQEHHKMDHDDSHELHVYISAFKTEDDNDLPCSSCEQGAKQIAQFICFHCNINLCEVCYELMHPVLLQTHHIVKRPNIIPERKYCNFCTPRKIATSICTLCGVCFCKRCLIKAKEHKCSTGELVPLNSGNVPGFFSLSERQIKREFLNVMKQKKKIIEEIPTFALRKTTKSNSDLVNGDRVVYFQGTCHYKATVRWVGNSRDKKEIIGVEFDDPVGNGNGAFQGERKFHCRDDHAWFITPIELIKEEDYDDTQLGPTNPLSDNDTNDVNFQQNIGNTEPGAAGNNERWHNSEPQDESLEIMSQMLSNPNLSFSSLEDISEGTDDTAQNNVGATGPSHDSALKIGDYVAYFHEDRFCKGLVKWIGRLPDKPNDPHLTVGVEFDEPIGSGTGKYNENRLFFARQNHASLIPLGGLMKYEDILN